MIVPRSSGAVLVALVLLSLAFQSDAGTNVTISIPSSAARTCAKSSSNDSFLGSTAVLAMGALATILTSLLSLNPLAILGLLDQAILLTQFSPFAAGVPANVTIKNANVLLNIASSSLLSVNPVTVAVENTLSSVIGATYASRSYITGSSFAPATSGTIRSPDLASSLQSLVNLNGWSSNSSAVGIAFVPGSGISALSYLSLVASTLACPTCGPLLELTYYDPCTPNPCQNNGQCTRLLGGIGLCLCSGLFNGTLCETLNQVGNLLNNTVGGVGDLLNNTVGGVGNLLNNTVGTVLTETQILVNLLNQTIGTALQLTEALLLELVGILNAGGCPYNVDYAGLKWLPTAQGASASQTCPVGSLGLATRTCCGPAARGVVDLAGRVCTKERYGTWLSTNCSQCVSTAIAAVHTTFLSQLLTIPLMPLIDAVQNVSSATQAAMGFIDISRVQAMAAYTSSQLLSSPTSMSVSDVAAVLKDVVSTTDAALTCPRGVIAGAIAYPEPYRQSFPEVIEMLNSLAMTLATRTPILPTWTTIFNTTTSNVYLGSWAVPQASLQDFSFATTSISGSPNVTKSFQGYASILIPKENFGPGCNPCSVSTAIFPTSTAFATTERVITPVIAAVINASSNISTTNLPRNVQITLAITCNDDDCNRYYSQVAADSCNATLDDIASINFTVINSTYMCLQYTLAANSTVSRRSAYVHPVVREVPMYARCVWWDSSSSHWSSHGCAVVSMSTNGRIVCECSHLTNFAVLVTSTEDDSDTPDGLKSQTASEAVGVISTIGCAVSALCLLLLVLVFILLRQQKFMGIQHFILSQLCLALFGSNLVFLLQVDRNGASDLQCQAASISLHYFLLATAFWMLVEAMQLYRAFVVVFMRDFALGWLMLKYFAMAWGAPAVIVAITAGLDLGNYTSDTLCWLNGPAIWAFLGPAGVIIVINIALWARVILQIYRCGGSYVSARATITLGLLVGVSWAAGILVIINNNIIVQYLFALLNAFQGVYIFYFHCLRSRDVRDGLQTLRSPTGKPSSSLRQPFDKAGSSAKPKNSHRTASTMAPHSPPQTCCTLEPASPPPIDTGLSPFRLPSIMPDDTITSQRSSGQGTSAPRISEDASTPATPAHSSARGSNPTPQTIHSRSFSSMSVPSSPPPPYVAAPRASATSIKMVKTPINVDDVSENTDTSSDDGCDTMTSSIPVSDLSSTPDMHSSLDTYIQIDPISTSLPRATQYSIHPPRPTEYNVHPPHPTEYNVHLHRPTEFQISGARPTHFDFQLGPDGTVVAVGATRDLIPEDML
eukprot:m.18105 g.18105  ORF g.18105 m.18105 type:complete len:1291 (+) comp3307_c0_seq1:71-3943(+)